MCIQSPGWVHPVPWHRSGAEQNFECWVPSSAELGPGKEHHTFLYAPVPTFPSTGKERLKLKPKANLRNISLYTNIWAPSFLHKE